MSNFREKQTVADGCSGSDEEEQTLDKVISSRTKAVPKRRMFLSNGGASTSAGGSDVIPEIGTTDNDLGAPVASLSAGHLWTDTVLMQTLEDKMGSSAGPGTTIEELRDRGTETYALKKAGEKRRRTNDIAEAMMDEDGTERGPMDGFKNTKASNRKEDKDGDDDADEALSSAVDFSVSLWEGVDTGAAEQPAEQNHGKRGKWKRFRRNNQHHQKQSHPWKNPFKQGLKKLKNDAKTTESEQIVKQQPPKKPYKFVPPQEFVPHKLLTPAYAQKKLFEAHFDAEALSEEQLAQGLAEALGETIPELLCKAVRFAGKSHAVELFKECQEVERNGGVLTQNRNRRRTPGGVFMKLFNESSKIGKEQKKAMFAFGSEKQRQSGRFPKWWDKMNERKEKRAEREQCDKTTPHDTDEAKELLKSNEVIKPELNTTEELTNINATDALTNNDNGIRMNSDISHA